MFLLKNNYYLTFFYIFLFYLKKQVKKSLDLLKIIFYSYFRFKIKNNNIFFKDLIIANKVQLVSFILKIKKKLNLFEIYIKLMKLNNLKNLNYIKYYIFYFSIINILS